MVPTKPRDLDPATMAEIMAGYPQPKGTQEDEDYALRLLAPAPANLEYARTRMYRGTFILRVTSEDGPTPADDCRALRALASSPEEVRVIAARLSRSAYLRVFVHLPGGPYKISPAHEQDFRLRIVDIPREALIFAASRAASEIYERFNVAKGGRGLKANRGLIKGPMWIFMTAMIRLYAETHGDKRTTATIASKKDNKCYGFVCAAYFYATGERLVHEKMFKKAVRAWKRRRYFTLAEILAFAVRAGSAPDFRGLVE